MPKRNAIKEYGEGEFYHCYNRGVNKDRIFRNNNDYGYFLGLFKRHLSEEPARDKTRRPYPHYVDQVELVAYCLMPNHYHLLLYLKEKEGIECLMRSVMTAYSAYYNRRYGRTGALFEGRFLASRIASNTYLWHASRYIHLNPLDIHADPLRYEFSSVAYFLGDKYAEWLHPEWLVQTNIERRKYQDSLIDQEEYHQLQHILKDQLADNQNNLLQGTSL